MRRPLIVDLAVEGAAAVLGRPSRSLLTTLGISIGVVALTSMIGMTASSSASIAAEFDALKPTRVDVFGEGSPSDFASAVGTEGVGRAQRLNGVDSVGTAFTSGDETATVSRRAHGSSSATAQVPLIATVGDVLDAEEATYPAGRSYDAGHAERGDNVVLVGEFVASQLGIGVEQVPSLVDINGLTFLVIGIVNSADSASLLPASLVLPESTAEKAGFLPLLEGSTTVLRTQVGAADQVATEVALAMSPEHPERLNVAVPPRPTNLQRAIEEQTRLQMLALAAVSIIVGAIGVSNTTLIGVMERRHEIGVRRAVGASRGAITVQFLFESAVLGLVGGAIGALAGVAVIVVVAFANSWVAVVPGWLPGLGPLIGLGVGLVAGAYPAHRASRIEPIEALR